MDGIIERALRGEATALELALLATWRGASLENERQYRQIARLIDAASPAGAADAPPPPGAAAILARVDRARLRRRRLRTRWISWSVAAAAVVVGIWRFAPSQPTDRWAPMEVTTGARELATVNLPDGSVVRLAPSSRLRVSQQQSAREVMLDGRAYFAVVKQPGRPFRVHTPAGRASVLGTRFELISEASQLQLRVLEGRVALEAPMNTVEVGAGEQSDVQHGSATRPTRVDQSNSSIDWLGQFLVFQATPLPDAAAQIERLFGARIQISDPELERQTVTATFAGQSVDRVMDVLCSVLSAKCTMRNDTVVMTR